MDVVALGKIDTKMAAAALSSKECAPGHNFACTEKTFQFPQLPTVTVGFWRAIDLPSDRGNGVEKAPQALLTPPYQ